jgi:hypothetical protein
MSIKLSCGCHVEDYTEAMMTSVRRWTKDGNHSIEVGMYCIYHREIERLNGDLLETIEEETKWLEQE